MNIGFDPAFGDDKAILSIPQKSGEIKFVDVTGMSEEQVQGMIDLETILREPDRAAWCCGRFGMEILGREG